jgi:glycosyltransferase involved in cell wall biosynthesis/GT2 family glycosyltransferase
VSGRPGLLVGVVLHTDPAALHGTLDALAGALGPDDRVVLVPDGPDPALATALWGDPVLAGLEQLAVDRPLGNAAAFNGLARALAGDEGALVFLENGARPAPDALDRLASALRRPGVGLAGPSTNDAWNEQRVLPGATGDPAGLREAAARLAAAYGDGDDGHRSLAPLHAPAEMCLAVAREVVEAVGAADEGFGRGPCWEMEYAARAVRAGFAAVWVGAAFVHRAPPTRRRRRDEPRDLAGAKRHYQDRLCGLRLDGTRAHHVAHCAGDACPHFAPPDRIVVHLPLGPATGPRVPVRVVEGVRSAASAAAGVPFVSCVLPTYDRGEWLGRAIEYFHRQDHPAGARELIVVDDGQADLRRQVGDLLGHPAITHLRLPARVSIGVKRNLGTGRARGDVIVHWDDDDWYGPERLTRQVAPLAAGAADLTGLRGAVWFDLDRWRFRRPTGGHHRRLFVEDVSGGTLAFRRSLWDRGLRYPDTSLAEDAAFLRDAVRRGFRLARLPADGVYLYLRHGTNSWRLPRRDERAGWQAVAEPAELRHNPDDRAFYAARSRAVVPVVPAGGPTVSCIMPTADRPDFVPAAIAGFLAQRHDAAELIVVDDGDEPVGHLVPDDPRVRYVRLDGRRVLGEKRNLAVEAARGEVVVHLDDDDWSHPDRLQVQVGALQRGEAEVCGLARMLWWDPQRRAAWRYTSPPVRRPWVAGNTLAYLRDDWRRRPFPVQALGEDTAFVWADRRRRVLPLDDERLVVGTIHPRNTSRKHPRSTTWTPVDPQLVLRLFQDAGVEVPGGAPVPFGGPT